MRFARLLGQQSLYMKVDEATQHSMKLDGQSEEAHVSSKSAAQRGGTCK